MKKLSEHLGQIIVVLAAIALVVSVLAVTAAPVSDFFGQIVDKETNIGQELMDSMETAQAGTNNSEDSEYSLSEVSPMAVTNMAESYGNSTYNLRLLPYYWIDVNSSSTLIVENNSSNISMRVLGLKASEISLKGDAIKPGTSATVTLPNGVTSIDFLLSKTPSAQIYPEDIDFSNFVVKYQGSDENLLEGFTSKASSLNNSSLKNFNIQTLSNKLENTKIIANNNASTSKNTCDYMESIVNAVETLGFEALDWNINITSDEVFVLYNSTTVTVEGVKTNVTDLTYQQIKEANSDIITLEEGLEYIKDKNITILTDIRASLTDEQTKTLSNLMREYLGNNFIFHSTSQNPEDINVVHEVTEVKKYKTLEENGFIPLYKLSIHNMTTEGKFVTTLASKEIKNYHITLTTSFKDSSMKNTLALSLYFMAQTNADLKNASAFANYIPDITDLTDKDLIKWMPKKYWDQTDYIMYN